MPTSLGEFMALATATLSLAAAATYWLVYATREVKGTAGAAVKTASTFLLAVLLAAVMVTDPSSGWLWLIPLGLAFGALGDLFLALGGMRMFLAGVAAFGLGHLAYAGGLLLWSAGIGFGGVSAGEGVALLVLLGLVGSTEVWLAPRTGALRTAVRGYVGLIGLMGVATILLPVHPGQGILRLGAALFLISDLLLALQLFVLRDPARRRQMALTLWPAYWAGQALIAWGAAALGQPGPV